MINEEDLDSMHLPLANVFEELETLSETKLQPFFTASFFEFCTRDKRDKGIDLTYEIKKNGKHSGFKFIIQLKSTKEKTPNIDGSISLQIDTSNINFLINNAKCAYYILYHAEKDVFYYEYLDDFLKYLEAKDDNWHNQPSHSLRFDKKFDEKSVKLIYDEVLKKGLFQRNLFQKAIIESSRVNTDGKILFDKSFNIFSDNDIKLQIEANGLQLINEGKWNDVIEIHNNGSQGNFSSLYNLIVGIAHYYKGNLADSLSYLRKANKTKSELVEGLKCHLMFFEILVKRAIGILSNQDYEKQLKKLESEENLGLYIKVEKAKNDYIETLADDMEKAYREYMATIKQISLDSKNNKDVKFNIDSDMIFIVGGHLNMQFFNAMSDVHAKHFGSTEIKTEVEKVLLNFDKRYNQWESIVSGVKKNATEKGKNTVLYNTIIHESKVKYEFEVYNQTISEKSKSKYPNKYNLHEVIIDIERALLYYEQIGYLENKLVCLSILYEINHFIKNDSITIDLLDKIGEIIEENELIEPKKKFEFLKNGGTTHEQLKKMVEGILHKNENIRNEFEQIRQELISIDKREWYEKKSVYDQPHKIQLFAVGIFQIPRDKTEQLYKILEITNTETKIVFDYMFSQKQIPIANVFCIPVETEGPLKGIAEDIGIESWRNLLKVRKEFYNNKFYNEQFI